MGLRVDVIADSDDSDPGFVGQRLVDEHNAHLAFHDRDDLPDFGSIAGSELVLLLGSARSAHAPEQAHVVKQESTLVRMALDSGINVVGICYGGQLLSHALGGSVGIAERPEIGLYEVSSMDQLLCPPGPWRQFHSDSFAPPPSARILGTSPSGCQGFADESRKGRAVGWQFHPEVTAARFITWIEQLRAYCEMHGASPDELATGAWQHEATLRQAAYSLTDAAIAWLRTP